MMATLILKPMRRIISSVRGMLIKHILSMIAHAAQEIPQWEHRLNPSCRGDEARIRENVVTEQIKAESRMGGWESRSVDTNSSRWEAFLMEHEIRGHRLAKCEMRNGATKQRL